MQFNNQNNNVKIFTVGFYAEYDEYVKSSSIEHSKFNSMIHIKNEWVHQGRKNNTYFQKPIYASSQMEARAIYMSNNSKGKDDVVQEIKDTKESNEVRIRNICYNIQVLPDVEYSFHDLSEKMPLGNFKVYCEKEMSNNMVVNNLYNIVKGDESQNKTLQIAVYMYSYNMLYLNNILMFL